MQAIVVFKTTEDAQKALAKDRELFCEPKFGSRFVRVLAVDETTTATHHSSEEQISSGHSKQLRNNKAFTASIPSNSTPMPSQNHNQNTAIKISGLPPNITIAEIVQLFWGTPAKSGSTILCKDPSKLYSLSYIDMGAPEAAAHAVVRWNGTVMSTASGKFSLTVQLATHLEYKAAAAAVKNKNSGTFAGEDDALVVKVRGLPIKASVQDVFAFLDGYKIKQQQGNGDAFAVHIQPLIGENRHSKVAYVEFESATEATRALEKNQTLFGKAFGDRYCLLQKISRQEMMAEIARNNVVTTTAAPGCPIYSNDTSFSNGSLDFTTSCASPAAFFNMHQNPFGNAAHQAAFMMPPPGAAAAAAAAHTPLPYAQIPWGMPPSGYFPQFANMMQQQFATLPGPQLWQEQKQQPHHTTAPPMQQADHGYGARYLVQDLSTGQKVYLDPRFNLYHSTGASTLEEDGGDAFPTVPPGATSFAAVNGNAMFPLSGIVPAIPIAPLVSDAACRTTPSGGTPSLKQLVGNCTAAAVAEGGVAVPTSSLQPSDELSHRTIAEADMAAKGLAAGQGSNEGSEDQGLECSPELPLAAAGETEGLQGDKGSDQGSKDGTDEGDQDEEHLRYYHHTKNGKAAKISPPDYSVASKDGHKRHSMELDLPEDDRPLKFAQAKGRS